MSALQDIALNLHAEAAEARSLAPAAPSAAPATRLARARQWFATLSIGSKITLFFSLNLAFALIAGLFVVAGYLVLGERGERIRSTHEESLKAEGLLVQISEGQRHAEMLVADGDIARARTAREALDRAAATATGLSESAETSGMAAFDRLALIREGIADLGRQVTAFNPNTADAATRRRQAGEIAATSGAALEAAQALTTTLGEEADAMADEYPCFSWYLRAKAFQLFSYDPDDVFQAETIILKRAA
jgi:methyl-accepting chemotaxis protein